ncbi:MAG: response regulator [Candidatus Accumulibacter meliphilus]|jgi:DNA-binding NarL/FixJ family response regulator|uniref:Response regulator n=1 Tax=Candidatus Accumulibacter meliphilus TaxID=2211374 RepID=A0A369XLX4_9PROT|nr:MAG: response regulator [Candidatus Accumulibacter meliphilus]
MQDNTAETLRILLVEDSLLLQDMLTEELEEIPGVKVCARATGEQEAIELLEVHPVDLAIVDLELSEGTGFGVLRQLHSLPERFGTLHAVVFSSYGHLSVRARCSALGVAAFFDKAVGTDALIDYVERLVPKAG